VKERKQKREEREREERERDREREREREKRASCEKVRRERVALILKRDEAIFCYLLGGACSSFASKTLKVFLMQARPSCFPLFSFVLEQTQ